MDHSPTPTVMLSLLNGKGGAALGGGFVLPILNLALPRLNLMFPFFNFALPRLNLRFPTLNLVLENDFCITNTKKAWPGLNPRFSELHLVWPILNSVYPSGAQVGIS